MAWASAAAEALGDERAQSRFLSHWGRACVRQGDYAEADGYFERGLKLAWKLIDSPSIARVLYERAQLLIERSELKAADEMLDECLEIYEELGDTVGLGETYRQKARAQFNSYKLELLPVALQHAKKALDILQSSGDETKLAPIIRLLIDISVDLKDNTAVRYYCELADKLSSAQSQHHDSRELALLHFSKSLFARANSNWAEATEEARQSLHILRYIGDRKSCAHVINVLGYIFLATEETEKARTALAEGISLLRQFHDPLALVWPLLRFGEAFKKLNRIQEARASWEEGLSIAEKHQHSLTDVFREGLAKLGD
jgi:tetratricopeptide (TPR) repeat protein